MAPRLPAHTEPAQIEIKMGGVRPVEGEASRQHQAWGKRLLRHKKPFWKILSAIFTAHPKWSASGNLSA
jgi:hypothetical protein